MKVLDVLLHNGLVYLVLYVIVFVYGLIVYFHGKWFMGRKTEGIGPM